MSRCSVCRHPERVEIESSLDLGWTQKAVAGRFQVSPSALSRHVRGHHTRLEEVRRELARRQAQLEFQEHMSAVYRVFSRGGWSSTQEIGEAAGRITTALVAAEDYSTLAGFMRATGCSESAIWSTVETAARGNGDDPGRVWESIFAPALEEVE